MGRKKKDSGFELDAQGRLNIQLSGQDAIDAIEVMESWGARNPQEYFRFAYLSKMNGGHQSPFKNQPTSPVVATSPDVEGSEPTEESSENGFVIPTFDIGGTETEF